MNFPEFNKLINPNNEQMYIGTILGKQPKVCNAKEINDLSIDSTLEINWKIPNGYFVIETREKNILPTIETRKEEVLVIEDPNKLTIICKGDFNRNTLNNRLMCGINANTIAPNKTILLPFKKQNNLSQTLAVTKLVYGSTINSCPSWLTPLRKISSDIDDGVQVPITGNTQVILLDILNKIKNANVNRLIQQEIIEMVNNEFCQSPLTSTQMDQLLQISEDQLLKQFFDKENFLHDRLGNYVIKNCFIKRDAITKDLYYYNEKRRIYSTDTDYIIGYMTKLVPSLKQYQKDEVVKYLKAFLYEDSVTFNNNPYTVVFKNGALNVLTMDFQPMSPDKLESIQINANYNPNSKSQIVDDYFNTATLGKKQIEDLLYEAMGYAMIKTNELQKAFLLVGEGRNGKSTFLDLVKEVLGKENTTSISFKDLASTFRASTLENKLASMAGDISSAPLNDSDLAKSLISGEEIMVEQKYKDPHSKAMFATLFFAANKLPRTPDQSFGFYRRLTIIPFNANLNSVSRVDGVMFHQKLLSQESLDYAAYKAVVAINRVLTTTKEFTLPQEVNDMLDKYRIENSSVLSWFHDKMKSDKVELMKLTTQGAFVNYKQWCEDSSRHPLNQTNFVSNIKSEIGIDLKPK